MAPWTLPEDWPGALVNLQYMLIQNLNIRGTIPDSWTDLGSWPKLAVLDLPVNFISGEGCRSSPARGKGMLQEKPHHDGCLMEALHGLLAHGLSNGTAHLAPGGVQMCQNPPDAESCFCTVCTLQPNRDLLH